MRVLLLSDWMSSRGGAEHYIVSLRDALRAAGDDTHLVSCGSAATQSDMVDTEAFGTDIRIAQGFLQISNPAASARIRKTVREFKPDVALVGQFAYHFSPSVVKALGSVPTILTMMDYKAICPLGTKLLPDGTLCTVQAGRICRDNGCVGMMHWMRDRPRYRRITKALASVKGVLCPTEWMRRELASAQVDATILPLGVHPPPSSFSRAPADIPTFAYCGRLSREKGVAVLIAAFAKCRAEIPEARLRILGDGPLRDQLEQLASVLGVSDSVEFTGWQAASAVDAALTDAWALVAPSLWAEPFGLIAIEAMMRAVPVLASDSGGFQESVGDNEGGLLFEPGSVTALAEGLLSVARGNAFPNHRLDHRLVERVTETYGMETHVSRMRQIFNEAIPT